MSARFVSVVAVALLIILISGAGCNMPASPATYAPPELKVPADQSYILTPKPSPKPRINGATAFGVTRGSPFLFTVAATGNRPMTFSAVDLPQTLALDPSTGRITGTIPSPGIYNVTVKAANPLGSAERRLQIVVGDKIALTPPMGWNSWNCWADKVSDENVRQSAKAMVDSGLVNHGWTYINIDDAWQAKRGGNFNAIQANAKFPDMKSLCDYVHSISLKTGIYSTPWITSYAGHCGGSSDNEDGSWTEPNQAQRSHTWKHGKFPFADNDAKQWAEWGIDYLKYDWNPNDPEHVEQMANALRSSGRDIVYSLSNTAPFQNAAVWAKFANCWRTTGDIRDVWSKALLPQGEKWALGILDIWTLHNKWAPFNGPGHFNDPDMLVVGQVGWGKPRPTRLSPDEQYTHISLWCLWSAPLLLGCPLDQLDNFTLNLLTNDEVLEIDQDPLAKQAAPLGSDPNSNTPVLVKDLADGTKAVGLFNFSKENATISVKLADVGVTGHAIIRDLWRQKDIATYTDSFSATVRPHGVILVKVTPVTK